MTPPNPAISVVSPTRGRPEQMKRLVQSALDNAYQPELVEFVFYIDEDDPCFDEYLACKNELPIRFCGGPSLRPIAAANILVEQAKAPWIAGFCDDMVVRSQYWDAHILGVAGHFKDDMVLMYASDPCGVLTAHPIFSKRVMDVLGYVMFPAFVHYCGDTWLHVIFQGVKRVVTLDKVVVEHLHYRLDKSEFDETYKRSHNADIGTHDQKLRSRLDRLLPGEIAMVQAEIDRFARENPELAAQIPVDTSK